MCALVLYCRRTQFSGAPLIVQVFLATLPRCPGTFDQRSCYKPKRPRLWNSGGGVLLGADALLQQIDMRRCMHKVASDATGEGLYARMGTAGEASPFAVV